MTVLQNTIQLPPIAKDYCATKPDTKQSIFPWLKKKSYCNRCNALELIIISYWYNPRNRAKTETVRRPWLSNEFCKRRLSFLVNHRAYDRESAVMHNELGSHN